MKIWGGPESIYFEIWGGRGPLGPPGSSAYVLPGAMASIKRKRVVRII